MPIICLTGEKAVINSCGQELEILLSFVETLSKGWQPFQATSDFDHETEFEVYIQERFCLKRLHIPSHVEQAMIWFTQHHHMPASHPLDCYDFANLVNEVPLHSKTYLFGFWEVSALPVRVRIGDTVFFLDSEIQMFYHAAIYLGFGIYVSIYGKGGDLEFSTLEDMRRDFPAQEVVLATPLT